MHNSFKVLYDLKEVNEQILASKYAGGSILSNQAVLCTLHCENRVQEKLLKMLLVEGM
jgi:hypothetical protein